jgi:hypothetical protein
MLISGLHSNVQLEHKDYILAEADGQDICLCVVDGSGKPLRLKGITRAKWFQIVGAVQKLMLRQDEAVIEASPGQDWLGNWPCALT